MVMTFKFYGGITVCGFADFCFGLQFLNWMQNKFNGGQGSGSTTTAKPQHNPVSLSRKYIQ